MEENKNPAVKVIFPDHNYVVMDFYMEWEATVRDLIAECTKFSSIEEGCLFLESKDGDHLLNEELLVSSVLQINIDSTPLIFKRKPMLINLVIVQKVYVDREVNINRLVDESKSIILSSRF